MSPVNVNVGGAWKSAASVHTKVGGSWKTASDMPVKVGGVWKTGILASNSYESIATSTLGSDTQSVTFSSIPSTYVALQLRIRGNSNGGPKITFNSNGSGYAEHRLVGNGSTASAGGSTGNSDFGNQGALVPGGGGGLSGQETAYILDIHDYQSTTKNKTIRAVSGYDANGSGSIRLGSGLWANTAAISTIKIDSDTGSVWYAGTVFSLYGIKGA